VGLRARDDGDRYAVAATDPIRHVVWVQVGIARGTLECILGVLYLAWGVVGWQQAGFASSSQR